MDVDMGCGYGTTLHGASALPNDALPVSRLEAGAALRVSLCSTIVNKVISKIEDPFKAPPITRWQLVGCRHDAKD
jgi:hypothetical protein